MVNLGLRLELLGAVAGSAFVCGLNMGWAAPRRDYTVMARHAGTLYLRVIDLNRFPTTRGMTGTTFVEA